jgi:perosamine synthetase
MPDHWREVPPTAGLPLQWRDFLSFTAGSLENDLAAFLRAPAAQIECSGTAALIIILTALKRDSTRRSVVIPAYTCPLVVLAILHCGLTPVLCDLGRESFDLCHETLDRSVNNDTLAIIPTHLGGRIADVDGVVNIARRHGACVIEDAAQSLGADAGAIGDAAFYSLAAGKGLTLYEGGVLVARDEGLRQAFKETSQKIAPYRLLRELHRLMQLAGYTALYHPAALRLAYGMPLQRALKRGRLIAAVGDDFSAEISVHKVGAWRRAIGANALKRLPAFLQTLSQQATVRKERLREIEGIIVIDDPEGSRGTWPFLMVLMPTAHARDAALARLWTAGLGVSRLFIHALPDYPYLAGQIGAIDIPNARDFAARMLTISNSPWLQDDDFSRICHELQNAIDLTTTGATTGSD